MNQNSLNLSKVVQETNLMSSLFSAKRRISGCILN